MKLLIVGPVACGKTYLAKEISKRFNIKHFEIDSIVHDDLNNRKRSNKEQESIIKNINNENKEWIIEGTLRKNLYNLLEITEKVIYLDIPISIRRKRILLRFIKQNLGIEKCNYKPNFKMLKMMYKWTNDFEKDKLEFEKILEKYKNKIVNKEKIYKIMEG